MENGVIKEFRLGTEKVVIALESFPENPRECFDTNMEIYHWHPSYSLGNEIAICTEEQFREDHPELIYVFPVFLFDHGNRVLSLEYPSCPFDSGQVGFIGMTEESAKDCANATEDEARQIAASELKIFKDYLNGDVFCWVKYKTSVCECCGSVDEDVVDSCGCFYGIEEFDFMKVDAGVTSDWVEIS